MFQRVPVNLCPSARTRHNGYFVDLFVRVSNALAISMYRKFGYTEYRCAALLRSTTKTFSAPATPRT
jgi:hypothetical protein